MFNKIAAVTKACAAVNAQMITLKGDDIHTSIESLLAGSNQGFTPKDSQINPKELMVFEGFNDDAMETFLNTYNATGIPKVVYKAMVTPINLKWTPAYLYEHLLDEVKDTQNIL